jgi:hypothetical protein
MRSISVPAIWLDQLCLSESNCSTIGVGYTPAFGFRTATEERAGMQRTTVCTASWSPVPAIRRSRGKAPRFLAPWQL